MFWWLSRIIASDYSKNLWLVIPVLLGFFFIGLAIFPFTKFSNIDQPPMQVVDFDFEPCINQPIAIGMTIGANSKLYLTIKVDGNLLGDSNYLVHSESRRVITVEHIERPKMQSLSSSKVHRRCPYLTGEIQADNPNIKITPTMAMAQFEFEEAVDGVTLASQLGVFGYFKDGSINSGEIPLPNSNTSKSGFYRCKTRGMSDDEALVIFSGLDGYCVDSKELSKDPNLYLHFRSQIDQLASDYSLTRLSDFNNQQRSAWEFISGWIEKNMDLYNYYETENLRKYFNVNLQKKNVSIVEYEIECSDCFSKLRGDFFVNLSFPRAGEKPSKLFLSTNAEHGFDIEAPVIVDGKLQFRARNSDDLFTKDFFLFLSALLAGVGVTLLVEVLILALHRFSQRPAPKKDLTAASHSTKFYSSSNGAKDLRIKRAKSRRNQSS